MQSGSLPPADEQREGEALLRVLEGSFHPRPPRLVADRYAIRDQLGRGATGSVWRACDRLTNRIVAVKLLDRVAGHELVRLRAEIAALRLLRVSGVAHLYDEGLHEGQPFLVTDVVEGAPFPGVVLSGGAAARWEAVRGPACALLEVLARVHACGVVHRDLKPGNVLVDAEGRPTVLDFGLVVGRGPLLPEGPGAAFCGTPAYAAPEQCAGDPIDARADLYAVGIMLYEALGGRRPHVAATLHELIEARLGQQAP